MSCRLGLCIAILALACGRGGDPDPASGGPVAVATSQAGRYRISVRPAQAAPLGALHEWIVRLERTDGAPATPTTVTFDGGMPSHGHGFVTAPRVTRELGDGEFLVEGVKFHMAGPWELRVAVTDAEGRDGASFQIQAAP